jgi:hypothetical protein
MIAAGGWRLLPHYRLDPATGLWHHVGREAEAPLSLHDVSYTAEGMAYQHHRRQEPESALVAYLAEARALMDDPPKPPGSPQGATDLDVGGDFEGLRWFMLPDEAARELAAQ